MYINEKKEEIFGIWLNCKRNRWLNEDEVNALKEENVVYFEQIINFDINKYNFDEEKEKLKNSLNNNDN